MFFTFFVFYVFFTFFVFYVFFTFFGFFGFFGGEFKVNFAESCKTRIFRFKDQKGHSGFYKDSALPNGVFSFIPFLVRYSVKWGFQVYPLSRYIIPAHGVFRLIPFLLLLSPFLRRRASSHDKKDAVLQLAMFGDASFFTPSSQVR